ncbi:hypothetical protein KO505_06470 [Psychrosphaera sp. F3M07]|uniref:hypothetical protein n=1 Tax=Psychrosphaera sp. F3M07 TaxID=2841560 RepID=UPI001C0842E8|nr:hypothetical protein [Psychrosphaera sp. F3M07]MBU2917607.1 hypothetical protein [Psychrosphaera sp. F3M07]
MSNKILITLGLVLVTVIALETLKTKPNDLKTEIIENNSEPESHIQNKLTDQNSVQDAVIEPKVDELPLKETGKATEPLLTQNQELQRQGLIKELNDLKTCHLNNSCPVDNSDSRASELLRGQKIKEKLEAYKQLTIENGYVDAETNELIRLFIDYPDGHVQEEVINMMRASALNTENALALISSLEKSYDAKIMNQAMDELLRYPNLSAQTDQLFTQSLQTGSFYVAQEIAQKILPYLNANNIALYESIAKTLPQNSKRANALWSNINEYKKKTSGG